MGSKIVPVDIELYVTTKNVDEIEFFFEHIVGDNLDIIPLLERPKPRNSSDYNECNDRREEDVQEQEGDGRNENVELNMGEEGEGGNVNAKNIEVNMEEESDGTNLNVEHVLVEEGVGNEDFIQEVQVEVVEEGYDKNDPKHVIDIKVEVVGDSGNVNDQEEEENANEQSDENVDEEEDENIVDPDFREGDDSESDDYDSYEDSAYKLGLANIVTYSKTNIDSFELEFGEIRKSQHKTKNKRAIEDGIMRTGLLRMATLNLILGGNK